MSDFRKLSETIMASPQISVADIATAKAEGVTLIINNRPDGEEALQIQGSVLEEAARELDLDYLAIPVTQAGFSLPQVDAMQSAIDQAKGKVLAFCRSGTRSTLLWSLAEAKRGTDPDSIAAAAMAAGYDISAIRQTIEMLAAESGK